MAIDNNPISMDATTKRSLFRDSTTQSLKSPKCPIGSTSSLSILVLTLVRLVVKTRTQKPPKASTGNTILDKLATSVHHGFYLLILIMAGSGIGMAILAGLPEIVFGDSGMALPKDFFVYPPRIAHAIIAKLLIIFVIFHIAGVIYHQLNLKDKLLTRMWFGK